MLHKNEDLSFNFQYPHKKLEKELWTCNFSAVVAEMRRETGKGRGRGMISHLNSELVG